MDHFSRADVRRAIVDFLRGRWVSVQTENGFRRYLNGRPLRVRDEVELEALLRLLGPVRTFYGTIEIYRRIESREDVYDEGNVISATPTWDIDSEINNWRATVEVIREIINFLSEEGVKNSVFIIWSGNGAHVHIHPLSISLNINPLDIAWSVTEFVRLKLELKVEEIRRKHNVEKLVLANEIRPRRVFTAPLCFHRKLDVVTVPILPEDLEDFDISWTSPGNFRFSSEWNRFSRGEADALAKRAYESIGGYPIVSRRRRKGKRLEDMLWFNEPPNL
ncbi:hypothetical protein [Candidatus Methanodesulfokora washburnensis]|jgi:hypothetical protein|uniref:Uncharacterized protein n=1 Tax=Candidatus Methanodesulfokora washburnensis TaxID=2478471 RepID=A0A3R9PEM0_9CREN|nr:hypothetical protein [Candidatus Methanodesulfokores washburnensis]RSN72320.1 hypothetical protein D6D85_14380 [Candidatus Methanodesulfokores washburnensis]